jgi:DUF1680 family protein
MERMMYNTILGAKPLEPDGKSFYYSDYNIQGKKVYSNHRWPCCSGTITQVATDYRINSYLRDPHGVWVNLYIPSTVRWNQGGAQMALTQKSEYPYDSYVQFEVTTSKATEFAMNLRIPAWAEQASLTVNGKRQPAQPGTFARVEREWRNGDRIDLELPLVPRIEAFDARHVDTVALLVGPVVLFALSDSQPTATRAQFLGAKRTGKQKWEVQTSAGTIRMVPFTAIQDEGYSTYLRVA